MNERPPYFIPNSPVIVCSFVERKIGAIVNWIRVDGAPTTYRQPHRIIRRATFDEFLETVKPEHRDWVRLHTMPEFLFYEAELD